MSTSYTPKMSAEWNFTQILRWVYLRDMCMISRLRGMNTPDEPVKRSDSYDNDLDYAIVKNVNGANRYMWLIFNENEVLVSADIFAMSFNGVMDEVATEMGLICNP